MNHQAGEDARAPLLSFVLIRHQHPAGGVALLRHFHECDHDSFAAGAGFFHHGVGEALGEFAFLVGGAALEHGDLD